MNMNMNGIFYVNMNGIFYVNTAIQKIFFQNRIKYLANAYINMKRKEKLQNIKLIYSVDYFVFRLLKYILRKMLSGLNRILIEYLYTYTYIVVNTLMNIQQ